MQILAQNNKTYTINVSKNDTIEDVKRKIQDQTAICPSKQTLIFNGKKLQDNIKLTDYDIPNLSVINIVTFIPTNVPNDFTIELNLSEILQFGDFKPLHTIQCDYTMTIKSILNDLKLNYISHILQIIIYYGDKNEKEICFNYQQIENETIFHIKNILCTQYDAKKCKNELHIKLLVNVELRTQLLLNSDIISSFSLPTKKIIESQIMPKLSEHVNGKNHVNIMMRLVSMLCTLKSSDTLLYEIVEFLTKFFEYEIPKQVDPTVIIQTILKVLSYSKSNKVTTALTKCLLNIKTYDNILDELDAFCDPCFPTSSLHNISKVYCELAKTTSSDYIEDKLFEQLYTLIFHEDTNVLINILISYHEYISLNYDISDNIAEDELVVTTKNKYIRKHEQNSLLFAGFIRKSLMHIQMKYLPNDLYMLIFSYYNGYYGKNVQANMVGRVMDLFKKTNNGYSKEITEKAMLVVEKVIEPLEGLNVIVTGSILVDTFWDYGFVNGLFVLMEHFKNNYDDDGYNISGQCDKCGNDSMGTDDEDTDYFYCIDCWGKLTLIKICDVMDFLGENEWTQNLCLKQIECLNENKFWEETKEFAKSWQDNNKNKQS